MLGSLQIQESSKEKWVGYFKISVCCDCSEKERERGKEGEGERARMRVIEQETSLP
jgi:hypothetical protein